MGRVIALDDGMVQLEADARKLVEGYAESGPYELNSDSKHVEKIIKALAKRKSKKGVFYVRAECFLTIKRQMQRLSVRVNTTWRR